jgi:hypothetical protein
VIEVSLSNKQTQMFKSLLAAATAAQERLNLFASALFGALEATGDVNNIQLVELNGTAKLVGVLMPEPPKA